MQQVKDAVDTQGVTTLSDQGRWIVPERPITTWWADVRRRFWRQRAAVVSGLLLILLALIAIFASVVAPFDPDKQFRKEGRTKTGQPLPPNHTFWLGTDTVGRDMLSRIIWGARISLGIGIVASAMTVGLAVLIGGGSGFVGGRIDFLIMRFVDLMMSVPTFFVILLLISMLKPSPWIVILVISIFGWTYPSRVFRAEMLSIKERDFVMAARCLGIPARRIFTRHLLPHLLSLVIVYLALSVPSVIF